MEKISNILESFFENLKQTFLKSPEWIYLIIGVTCLIMLIGIIQNKKWAIDPNSSNQRFFYNTFGHTAFRFVVGFIFLLGCIAGFSLFLLYFFQN